MATYAIGDIHGCLTALKTIFKKGPIVKGDTVVFLGDYIDRGPNSAGVIDWLIQNRDDFHFEFILGNHEIMMQAAKVSQDRLLEWLHFGGAATLDSYHIGDHPQWMDQIPQSHWEFVDSCLPYYEMNDNIFVHAGLETGKDLIDQNRHHLFWKKYITPEKYLNGKTVICGHTSRKNGEIANFEHTICIDTYAYGGMWLTCLNVETKTYFKANNKGKITTGVL